MKNIKKSIIMLIVNIVIVLIILTLFFMFSNKGLQFFITFAGGIIDCMFLFAMDKEL